MRFATITTETPTCIQHVQGGQQLTSFQKKQLVLKVRYLNKEKEGYDESISKINRKVANLESALSTVNQHWDQVCHWITLHTSGFGY